jgi:mannosyltransferase OCH1-like enzyme
VCHQTWITHSLPDKISELRSQNQRKNPTVKFVLYDDNDIVEFLKDEMPADVLCAYNRIDPKLGAAKADFFRYCVMLIKGGIYLDIKSELTCSLFDCVIKPSDECILDKGITFMEEYRGRLKYHVHEQWLLIAKPGHPYFKEMVLILTRDVFDNNPHPPMQMFDNYDSAPTYIKQLFTNTSAKQNVLRTTGPDMLAVAIHKIIITIGVLHREEYYQKFARLLAKGITRAYLYGDRLHYSQVL